MIDKMNLHYAFTNPASIHDEEALTALELAGRQGAKINEVVTDQNKLRSETEHKLESQDKLIDLRLDEQDANIHVMNTVNMPAKVTQEVQEQINDGTFDKAIDKYAGELEARVNNLLSNTPSGSTTMDAEVIDGRVGYNEVIFQNLGTAIREQIKIFARRYRNHVLAYPNTVPFLFNTTNKTITFNSSGVNLFGNNCYCTVPAGDYVVDYSNIYSATYGGSFMLMWNNTDNEFYLTEYSPNLMTEAHYVVMGVYVDKNGKVKHLIGCDDIISKVKQDGELVIHSIPSEVEDAHIGYDDTEYNSLGIAIREQIKKVTQRYRNHVVGYVNDVVFNIDTTNKVITFNNGGAIVLYGDHGYCSVPAGDYSIDWSGFYNEGYGNSFNLMWDTTTNEFYLRNLNATSLTEGDYLVFTVHMNGNATVKHIMGCDDILSKITVNGVVYKYTTAGEVEDAHKGYNGTVYNTLGDAVREQVKKFAQRYRNYVQGVLGKFTLAIDTTNKKIVYTPTNSNTIFGHVGYCSVSAGTYELDYSSIVGSYGATFHVLWDATTNALEGVFYRPDTITENKYVLLTVYGAGNGNINTLYGCDDILKNLTVGGAPWLASSNVVTNKSTCNIFRKVVCCGDSYTAGYIVDSEGVAHPTNEEYAYPHYMSNLTGNTWENCGCSGCNVLTWQTHERGLPKAQSLGKAQAYVVGLMINDCGSSDRHVDIGTIDDIGTDAQTYYGGMSKVVESLAAISPDAKIFICTCPNTGSDYVPYNQAVRDIVEYYKDTYAVHCLDLYANIGMYKNASLTGDALSGHYTAIGYEQFAEILSVIMSNYINNNISDFQDVAFIEYDN